MLAFSLGAFDGCLVQNVKLAITSASLKRIGLVMRDFNEDDVDCLVGILGVKMCHLQSLDLFGWEGQAANMIPSRLFETLKGDATLENFIVGHPSTEVCTRIVDALCAGIEELKNLKTLTVILVKTLLLSTEHQLLQSFTKNWSLESNQLAEGGDFRYGEVDSYHLNYQIPVTTAATGRKLEELNNRNKLKKEIFHDSSDWP